MVIKHPGRRVRQADQSRLDVKQYFDILLLKYWNNRRYQEPTRYFSLHEAIACLSKASGLSMAWLAAHLGILTNRLNMIAIRQGPLSIRQFGILVQLAKSYSLPVLADYFDTQQSIVHSSTAPRRGRKPHGLSADEENTPEWAKTVGDW